MTTWRSCLFVSIEQQASLDFGSPDLYAVGRLLAIVYFNLSPSLQASISACTARRDSFREMSLPTCGLQVTDVSVGEEVEVQSDPEWSCCVIESEIRACSSIELRVDSDLIDCGARRSWLPLPFKGKWVRAVVRSVQPSTLLCPNFIHAHRSCL